jgi:hypothetical protein
MQQYSVFRIINAECWQYRNYYGTAFLERVVCILQE